jgi:octaprenyl-diphosphate synthase
VSQTVPRQNSIGLAQLVEPVANELKEVEKTLFAEMRSDVPWMNELLKSSSLAQGKRMRPLLLLLCGSQCGELGPGHVSMAAALEMIHVATLVHDDILDGAESRRHQPTVGHKHGQHVGILLGDYLFTHAFSVSTRTGSADAISILARASNRVCEGEMRQNFFQGDLNLKQSQYLEIVSDKTAELVAAACHLGAALSGANEHVCAGFEKYGRDLGIAFQIVDDVLDIVGDVDDVGKTLGTDAANSKLTLPVIHCRNSLNDEEQAQLLTYLTSSNITNEGLMKWLKKTESIEYARDLARGYITEALTFAKSLKPTAFSASLTQVAEFVLRRTH